MTDPSRAGRSVQDPPRLEEWRYRAECSEREVWWLRELLREANERIFELEGSDDSR